MGQLTGEQRFPRGDYPGLLGSWHRIPNRRHTHSLRASVCSYLKWGQQCLHDRVDVKTMRRGMENAQHYPTYSRCWINGSNSKEQWTPGASHYHRRRTQGDMGQMGKLKAERGRGAEQVNGGVRERILWSSCPLISSPPWVSHEDRAFHPVALRSISVARLFLWTTVDECSVSMSACCPAPIKAQSPFACLRPFRG